jgi:hypothetical protein
MSIRSKIDVVAVISVRCSSPSCYYCTLYELLNSLLIDTVVFSHHKKEIHLHLLACAYYSVYKCTIVSPTMPDYALSLLRERRR